MLIVGLGNPGEKYDKTRHNIGFMYVDKIAEANKCDWKLEKKFQSMVTQINIGQNKHILLKPLTFMNLSGNAVASFIKYYGILVSDIIIIYDDMDIPLGQIRIRQNGSSGGHKGMKSVIDHLQTQDISRIRIGIGKNNNINVVDYVLENFSKKEVPIIEEVLALAPIMFKDLQSNGFTYIMNQYNGVIKE